MDGTAAARIEELIEHLETGLAALRIHDRAEALTLIERLEQVTGRITGTRLALIQQAAITVPPATNSTTGCILRIG